MSGGEAATDDGPGPLGGWHADPRAPAERLRWWDGHAWTVVVAEPGEPDTGISWIPSLADLPPPAANPTAPPVVVQRSAPGAEPSEPARGRPVPGGEAPPLRWTTPEATREPAAAAPGATTEREVDEARPWWRRRRILVPELVGLVVIGLAAAASAGVFSGGVSRPQVEAGVSYRDTTAGFALRYPDGWHVLGRRPGESIRFAVGPRGVPTTDTNTVSVVVGSQRAPLPALHLLADQVTEGLRASFSGIRLDVADRTTLAHGPALRLRLSDADTDPPTLVEQLVGRTTTGRPLSVTLTIRDPRTAPTARDLRAFLASIGAG